MRSITLRPGESLKIGDTIISAEHSDLKSDNSGSQPEINEIKALQVTSTGTAALLRFLNAQSVEDQRAFAVACGTTVGYLRQVAYEHRQCSASLAIVIDRESGGAVSFESLCPDADWEYVRSRALRQEAAHA